MSFFYMQLWKSVLRIRFMVLSTEYLRERLQGRRRLAGDTCGALVEVSLPGDEI